MEIMNSATKSKVYRIYWIFIVCYLCSVNIGFCEVADDELIDLKLIPSIKEVVHFENDSYIVACQANETRLRWFNPQSQWVEDNLGRVHIEEQHENELSLVFSSIQYSDNGNWTCQAEKNNQKTSFSMIVYKPIIFVDTPTVQSVKENEEAIIKCMVTGDPLPNVSWYYNGEQINLDEKKYVKLADGLLIKRVQKNDSGEYTCKAFQISPALSDVKEQTIRLNIQHKPVRPIRRESADIQYGYIKGIVNVTCEAQAEPPAKFRWYRHNKQLNPEHHQIIIGEHMSMLQLHLNHSKQFGEYICEATNSLGTLKRSITLLNGTKPAPPPTITLRGVNSNTFDLDVGAKKTGAGNLMDVNGYRFEIVSTEEHRNNGGKWTNPRVVIKDFVDGMTYLINNLTPNTTYLVRVASRNPAGLSDFLGPKEFRTHAKAAFGTHLDVSDSANAWSIDFIQVIAIYIAYEFFNRIHLF